ncbi:putative zinc finger protein 705E [Protopterus annectens]|uniref:putative zinc finger protein 705E n=1 Tax=Protopterus annectens TaxID=7888 RepID=UPI001CFB5ADD|nr:putative zinc finger protein 705E [Protopterus annectens]
MKLEVPESFEDVLVDFTREEWNALTQEERELHREVMVQNYVNMVLVGYNISNEHLFLLLEKHGELVPDVKECVMARLQQDLCEDFPSKGNTRRSWSRTWWPKSRHTYLSRA